MTGQLIKPKENPALTKSFPILKRWEGDNSLSLKMEGELCQCCGMPMAATEHFGTEIRQSGIRPSF
jgi:hypothetical protein